MGNAFTEKMSDRERALVERNYDYVEELASMKFRGFRGDKDE